MPILYCWGKVGDLAIGVFLWSNYLSAARPPKLLPIRSTARKAYGSFFRHYVVTNFAGVKWQDVWSIPCEVYAQLKDESELRSLSEQRVEQEIMSTMMRLLNVPTPQ